MLAGGTDPPFALDYVITFAASVDTFSDSQTFSLKMKNPCIIPEKNSITGPAEFYPLPFAYKIGSTALEIPLAGPFSSNIDWCGSIDLKLSVDAQSKPIVFNAERKLFIVDTADESLDTTI